MTERDIREAIRATCGELDEDAQQRGLPHRRGLQRALLPALAGAGLAIASCSGPVAMYDAPGGPPTTSSTGAGGGGGGGGQGGEAGQGGAGGETAQGGGGSGQGGGTAGSGGMAAPMYMAPDEVV